MNTTNMFFPFGVGKFTHLLIVTKFGSTENVVIIRRFAMQASKNNNNK